jgi:uncharacterized membrane protein YedE/YeeE
VSDFRVFFSLGLGVLFGAGLALSGMTDPQKVLGFLDVFGQWDLSLMFVMGSALVVTVPGFQWVIKKRERPFSDTQFFLPTSRAVDKKLVVGAILFGAGWGLYGVCPGPAMVGLIYGQWQVCIFVVAMLAGMWLCDRFSGRFFK